MVRFSVFSKDHSNCQSGRWICGVTRLDKEVTAGIQMKDNDTSTKAEAMVQEIRDGFVKL
jgi:hypothetical protein